MYIPSRSSDIIKPLCVYPTYLPMALIDYHDSACVAIDLAIPCYSYAIPIRKKLSDYHISFHTVGVSEMGAVESGRCYGKIRQLPSQESPSDGGGRGPFIVDCGDLKRTLVNVKIGNYHTIPKFQYWHILIILISVPSHMFNQLLSQWY